MLSVLIVIAGALALFRLPLSDGGLLIPPRAVGPRVDLEQRGAGFDDLAFAIAVAKAHVNLGLVWCSDTGTAKAALRRIVRGDERPPVALLLDIKLSNENGFALLEWIRSHPELTDLPVVMASSSTVQADIDKAVKLGANAFVEKTSSEECVLEVLRCILASTGTMEQRLRACVNNLLETRHRRHSQ